jgi:hypothetical protein
MHRTASRQPSRKAKKSYTLSPESVEFLEALRRKRSAPSVSAVLEEILQEVRRKQAKAKVEAAVWGYYDSLSEDEIEEQTAWGRFGLQEFSKETA